MASSRPPGPLQVLVVDDNEDLADNVAELFSDIGCQVRVAHTGSEACERLEKFDLAVLDIRLPDMLGVELLPRLKQVNPDGEVILMTANATVDTAVSAVREGAFAYVQKPFGVTELLSLGERALTQVGLRKERARLQRELSRSETLYRSVVDTVDALIVGVDGSGDVRMWNRSAETATGHVASAVLGSPFEELLVSERGKTQLRAACGDAIAGAAVADLELSLWAADGRERVVRWSFSQLSSAESLPALALCVGADMTDRIELERRAADAEAMASIATLTAGLAHEIRNPLNAATLQLELLSRGAQKLSDLEQQQRIEGRVKVVREELGRLSNLLSDFLDLARPRALELRPVELQPLLAEVAEMHAPPARACGIAVDTVVEGEAVSALGDRNLLTQVLVNLVLNAVDAQRAAGQGRVRLSCHNPSEERVSLEVEDHGPGVPAELQQDLFTPFATSKEAGTGLGLTIVKRIIDRHGGTVRLSPRKGGGTVARVTLKRAHR